VSIFCKSCSSTSPSIGFTVAILLRDYPTN
jgi:hypothetical protein